MTVVCTSSINQVGNTFLNWSLYYLNGETENLVIREDMSYFYNQLPESPLSSKTSNAHSHLKTHREGRAEFDKCLEVIRSQPDQNRLYCLYPKMQRILTARKHVDNDDLSNVLTYMLQDYASIAESCTENNVKLIHNHNNNHYRYFYRNRDVDGTGPDGIVSKTILEQIIRYIDWACPEMRGHFNNCENTWDLREALAIGMQVTPQHESEFTDYSQPHFYLEATSLWFDGPHVIKNIMDYCGLTIDQSRWDKWKIVYYQWQEIARLPQLRLTRNVHHVCQCILNSWDHDLTQYNLDIIDESFIQHLLIYKHNTTIKGWGMLTSPDNTKHFHDLLEPSFYQGLELRSTQEI